MNQEIKIRKAEVADAPAISRVFQKSWQVSYAGIVEKEYLDSLPETHWVEFLTAGLAEAGGFSGFVAEQGEKILGAIIVGPSAEPDFSEDMELYCLYVDPERQCCGIGSLLFESALEHLRQLGKTAAYLYVFDANKRAIALYERHGFQVARIGGRVALGQNEYDYSIMRHIFESL